MTFTCNNMRLVIVFFLVIVLVLPKVSTSQVPCFFIFGDSLVDNGNNNQLDTIAKVNYLPYGIDFPQGPSGRFTNGRTTVDFIAEFLGFKNFIPPYATVQLKDIIKGVNYGSGGAGILDETGQHLGDRISLNGQLKNHNRVAQLIRNESSGQKHLKECLYMLVIGNNDYISNYYAPKFYNTSYIHTTEEYATLLIQQYSQQLKTLYSYGARKIALNGVGSIGCIPFEAAKRTNGSLCVDSMNDAAKLFDDKLKHLVDELNKSLTDAKFILLSSMMESPTQIFALSDLVLGETCCKVSKIGQCTPGEDPCLARTLHIYYDDFHTTEIVNKVMATAAYAEILKLIL